MTVIVKRIGLTDTSSNRLKRLICYIKKPQAAQETSHDVWFYNAYDNKSGIAEMLAINSSNPRGRRTYEHLVISYDKSVYPARSQSHQACEITLRLAGLAECIAMAGLHYDKSHIHIHLVVVAIHPVSRKSIPRQWFIESLHRSAAIVNYIQKWGPQNHQIYSIIKTNQQLVAVRNLIKSRTLKKNAVTTYYGQRSAAEYVEEVLQRALYESSIHNWHSLHQDLANNGIVYKQQGKGYVYVVNQIDKPITIKASSISINKRIKTKFGLFKKFNTKDGNPIIKFVKPKPARWMSDLIRECWEQFYQLKIDLLKQHKDLKVISKNRMNEFDKLNIAKINSPLNAGYDTSKALRDKHRTEKSELKKLLSVQTKELQAKFNAENGPVNNFIDYLKYVNLFEKYQADQKQYQQSKYIYANAVCITPSQEVNNLIFIKGYQSETSKIGFECNSFREYWNQDGNIDFVIEGSAILLKHVYNIPEVIRAFLTLASTKWDKFRLNGSLDFQFQCAIEAREMKVEHKIINLIDTSTFLQKVDAGRFETNINRIEAQGIHRQAQFKPKCNFLIWPIPREIEHLEMKISSKKMIMEPKTIIDYAINAYLLHSNNLGNKPKNNYLKDLEIAIRLRVIGFSDFHIASAIKAASPLVLESDVHSNYSKHLLVVINDTVIEQKWRPVVELKKQEWLNVTGFSFNSRIKDSVHSNCQYYKDCQ